MSLWLGRTLLAHTYRRALYVHRAHVLLPNSRSLSSTPRRLLQSSSKSTQANVVDPEKPSPAPPVPKELSPAPLTTRVWKKVKHEAQHYWHGTKLLVSDVRIASKLQWKILHGDTLTRRERRQVCNHFTPSSVYLVNSFSTAQAYYSGFAAAYSFFGIHNRTFHGIPSPCGFEIVPQYASVYF